MSTLSIEPHYGRWAIRISRKMTQAGQLQGAAAAQPKVEDEDEDEGERERRLAFVRRLR